MASRKKVAKRTTRNLTSLKREAKSLLGDGFSVMSEKKLKSAKHQFFYVVSESQTLRFDIVVTPIATGPTMQMIIKPTLGVNP